MGRHKLPRDQGLPGGSAARSPAALVAGALVLAAATVTAEPVAVGAEPPPVLSLLEQRHDLVVLQGWDYSCGAASLATLLNFQHGDPVSEREIALGLMAREEYVANPILVNLRQGFSLADLKIYVDDRGYHGRGIGRLDLEELIDRAPAIVPIIVNGSSHFVVFRGRRGNRVLLADPLFGNRTMTTDQFQAAWPEHEKFGRVGFVVERVDGLPPPNRLAPAADDFLTLG